MLLAGISLSMAGMNDLPGTPVRLRTSLRGIKVLPFAIVAMVIDRRSFLLAAIGYLLTVIFSLNPVMDDAGAAFIILGLGVFLVLLGAFWSRVRAAILAMLPLGRVRAYLPAAY